MEIVPILLVAYYHSVNKRDILAANNGIHVVITYLNHVTL